MYQYNLGQVFIDISRKNKDKQAIVFDGDESISFHELDCLSNKLANFFLEKNLEKRDVIAIQNKKSPYGFAAMLACLKLGIIYTNFDYTNPEERIKKIFYTACPKLVFADEYNDDMERLCRELSVDYIAADRSQGIIGRESETVDNVLIDSVSGNMPAYIMFTSGSTGVPKGVLIKQNSLLNFIKWGKKTYGLTQEDILTNVNPIYFDNSVFDFYCSVFNGITMVAISKEILERPKEMLEAVENSGCTFWFSVPSMLIYLMNLKLLTKNILGKIRIFSFGGEGYPKELLRKLYHIYKDTAEFYNVYGPTEGTCICSAYKITESDMKEDGLAPLGKISANFEYVILDEEGNQSAAGELCLIGEQLALGYYNDAERTRTAFVECHHIGAYRERMYRTGDRVEELDGKLYFKGRIDNQIKHMGYRIELEEIENALIKIPGLKQCAVIHTLSKNGFSKIVAFVAGSEMANADMRNELKKYLPGYMIPNAIEHLDELPKNANGKVDRVLLKKQYEQEI